MGRSNWIEESERRALWAEVKVGMSRGGGLAVVRLDGGSAVIYARSPYLSPQRAKSIVAATHLGCNHLADDHLSTAPEIAIPFSPMPQYWWVNHKQTFRQEIEGEYLWSPKRSRSGARNEFYNNMRRAAPGDLVLSFANGLIRHVGRVTEFAFTAPKPEEFGQVGAYWHDEGWLLPVFWTEIQPSIRPRDILPVLAPLLPKSHSPFNVRTGSGNQGAYLAHISPETFEAVVTHGRFDHDALRRGGTNRLNYDIVIDQLEDVVQRRLEHDATLDETTKDSLIKARRGQGKFRRNVEAIERACRLTGITNPTLLNASHIKPWRLCESGSERLDGMNGLLLTPDADRLFDRGFITFEDNGDVRVSERVDVDDMRRLGFESLVSRRFGRAERPAIWRSGDLHAAQKKYMQFHRMQIFVS